jgi:hypothetical protein
MLEDAEARQALLQNELRQSIQDGLDSGSPLDADEVFERLEEKYQAQVDLCS